MEFKSEEDSLKMDTDLNIRPAYNLDLITNYSSLINFGDSDAKTQIYFEASLEGDKLRLIQDMSVDANDIRVRECREIEKKY